MKTIAIYTLETCNSCMKCLKTCPVSAINIKDNRIVIDDAKCINCAKCIKSCKSNGLTAKGSTIIDIANYPYTICLVPSALINHCKTNDEINSLFYAIKMLGFDEVIDLTYYESLIEEAFLNENDNELVIKSSCPVIKNLVKQEYLTLSDNLSRLDYPSEVAARDLRNKHKDKNIGIFLLCECSAKLILSKYPYGDTRYEVDHALAIRDVFPLIQMNLKEGVMQVDLYKQGLCSTNVSALNQNDTYLCEDSLQRAEDILELLEFGRLNDVKRVNLLPCFGGCLSGDLLWGNSYTSKHNYKELNCKYDKAEASDISLEDVRVDEEVFKKKSFKERVEEFKKIERCVKELPGYDCGACGYPSCSALASAIVNEVEDISRCKVRRAIKWRENED